MIIIGYRTRDTKSHPEDILKKSCPECRNDLEKHDIKRWFTFFFIPIFPFSTVQTFYKCQNCGQTYKESIKEHLNQKKGMTKSDNKLMYAITAAAAMARMAKIKGMTKAQEKEFNKLIKKYPKEKEDIEKIFKSVLEKGNDQHAVEMITLSRRVLAQNDLKSIMEKVAGIMVAGGKITKQEEELMKDYLLVSGLSKSDYDSIVAKARKS